MTTATPRSRGSRTRRRGRMPVDVPKLGFRPDIEGLRAVAVLFVLVWHAGVSWLPGGFVGVDVFFVVSGFLMTSILHRELLSKGRISVADFYARRARRLIPASALTLVVTAVATYLILPETRWRDIGLDIAAAGGYVVNWRLADRSVDYLAQDTAPSPIQHFWSLSVEEQFYIFWPILLLAIGWLIAKTRGSATRATSVTLAAIGAFSLAWSIYLTAADAGPAYFVTTTRLWELALGGLVALSMPFFMKMSSSIAAAMAWIGVAGIIATGFLLTTDLPFPGSVALIPTVATAMVIAAGPAAGKAGPVSMFNNKVVLWIGGCSYSMYLWHWPVLIVGGYWVTDGLRDITVTEGVALVVLSVLPAWLSLRYVENPVRKWEALTDSVRNSLMLAFLGIAACLSAGMVLTLAAAQPSIAYVSQYVPDSVKDNRVPTGAETLDAQPRNDRTGEPVDAVPTISPAPTQIKNDFDRCPVSGLNSSEVLTCKAGDPKSATKIVAVGDSHMQQWMPALEVLARKNGWSVTGYFHDACPFVAGDVIRDGRTYTDCVKWNSSVRQQLLDGQPPTLVMTSAYTSGGSQPSGSASQAIAQGLEPFAKRNVPIAIVRDTPDPGIDMAECVAANTSELTKCARPRAEVSDPKGEAQVAAAQAVDGAVLVDLNDAICPTESCAAVIGGLAVYRDTNHITTTYARTLAPRLEQQLPLR